MTDMELTRPSLQVNKGKLVGGALLIAAGGVLVATGVLLGTYAVATATRHWVKQLEVPPSELARRKLHQARLASAAAATAWRNQESNSTPPSPLADARPPSRAAVDAGTGGSGASDRRGDRQSYQRRDS
jgi:hypothetical protein